jgi:hypothetical protein
MGRHGSSAFVQAIPGGYPKTHSGGYVSLQMTLALWQVSCPTPNPDRREVR